MKDAIDREALYITVGIVICHFLIAGMIYLSAFAPAKYAVSASLVYGYMFWPAINVLVMGVICWWWVFVSFYYICCHIYDFYSYLFNIGMKLV